MLVRVQWKSPDLDSQAIPKDLALALSSLLVPLAVLAFSVSFWAFAAELKWTGPFVFSRNLLARWQVWLAMAALLWVLGQILSGYDSGKDNLSP